MASVKVRGFGVIGCPRCGAGEGLAVRAHNLAVECTDCGETITRGELIRMAENVRRLLAWIDLASTIDDIAPAE